MEFQESINKWDGGRNTDTNKGSIPPNQYLEAHNLELVGDGNFFALQNIKGTTELNTLSSDPTAEEIGAFATKYLIGGVLKKCVTYFVVTDTLLKVFCYDTEADYLYELYEETIAGDYNTDNRVVDAINYPENGIDFLYFTDFYNPPRFIKCEIPSPYTPNFLTASEITLQRTGALGTIALSSVASGGSLLSGTYQFAYRMSDPVNKKFTKWSTITNPIHVYTDENSTSQVNSGIGVFTNRKITLSITPSTIETDTYDYLQLAVIENVASTAATTASLLEITSIPGSSLSFDYKANSRIGEIPLSDLTVDLAQIEKVKTLRVAGNRLFGANVSYTALEYDNGRPAITTGTISKRTSSFTDCFSDDEFASKYIGYFRDEVYRFGVVYEDQYGNKSSAIALDLSGVTGNTISGSTDMKFPARSSSNSYTLFDGSGYLQSLGLQLNGIVNHPSWARKLHIVRVARKKNTLFQSPAIPMVDIYGVGALDNYPTIYNNGTSSITVDSAQPMTSGRTLHPKNMFWPEMKCIRPFTINSGSGTNTVKKGEALLQHQSSTNFFMVWPSVYATEPYVFTGAEKFSVVDKALLKLNVSGDSRYGYSPSNKYTAGAWTTGDDANTNISGNFYALSGGDYYFDSSWAAKSIPATETNRAIVDSETFDNLAQTASVSGVSTMDYASLQTTGINLGYQPNIQKSTVVNLSGDPISDISASGANGGGAYTTFVNGQFNVYGTGGGYVIGSSGIQYESNAAVLNDYVTTYASFSNNSYCNACNIVNITLGLGDDRYGGINAYHEFIDTGASYTFSTSEIADLEAGNPVSVNVEVFGGDCFVGPQIFKISDSSYSVTNQTNASQTASDLVKKWGLYYANSFGRAMRLPVALENVSQYVTVILESEYNGEVRDYDILVSQGDVNGMPYLNNASKESMRTPLTYRYNINLSRGNYQKVFVPQLQYSFKQNDFKARVIWSDIKIYNSDQAGFDIFRVADFVDLQEQRYGITKLVINGDKMFAIQEQGVVYLPVGERQVEQTDAELIAVRSGDVVGRPFIVDSKRGSQHLRGIIETGNAVFIPDARNKSVYWLTDGLEPITKDNETIFRTIFSNNFGEKYVKGVYDFVRGEYWLMVNESTQVFNIKGAWVGDQEWEPSAVYQDGLFAVARDGSNLKIYSMYTGTPNQLAGVTVVPRLVYCSNPESQFSKTFDVMAVTATEDLSTMDMLIENESGTGNQTVTGVNLASKYLEGKYVITVPKDASRDRMRGLKALITIKWGTLQSALQDITMKWRPSKRYPF